MISSHVWRCALAIATLAALPGSANAQDGACPAGSTPAVFRLSKLIPGGTLDGARKAAALHQRWYADHGYAADQVVYEPVMTFDPVAKRLVMAGDQYVTMHTHSSDVPPDKHDESWKAFVAAYDAQSTIVSTVITCMP